MPPTMCVTGCVPSRRHRPSTRAHSAGEAARVITSPSTVRVSSGFLKIATITLKAATSAAMPTIAISLTK